jgi:hypothetical protein
MARANRHFIPGQIWHSTHRCRKKEWLLKFSRDRRRWLQWLYKAKKRKLVEKEKIFQLREQEVAYMANLMLKKEDRGGENSCF